MKELILYSLFLGNISVNTKLLLISLLSLFLTAQTYAVESINIISREEWKAESSYNNLEETQWQNIISQRSATSINYESEAYRQSVLQTQKINDYLNENFSYQFKKDETIYYNQDLGYKYAWPLTYSPYIDSIIIHHTDTSYNDSLTGVRDIHRFHSLSRQWGDIGYNFLIGEDGEIYEGREGGDYISGAHSKYNNIGTIGIAVIGNFHSEGLNDLQYHSLDLLIKHLTKKYGIDLSKKRYYHMACSGEACNNFPIETYLDNVLVGHRDTGHTSCPGDELYAQIQKIREDNLSYTSGFQTIYRSHNINRDDNLDYTPSQMSKLQTLLSKYSKTQKESFLKIIDAKLESENNTSKISQLKIIQLAIQINLKLY